MEIAPPEQIAWLVEAVGEDAALAFVESVAGQRVWVPRRANGSELARLFGEQIAAAVSEQWGGLKWDVPVCREWRAMILYCRGLPTNDIALRVGCSRSRVIRILNMKTPRVAAARSAAQVDDRQMAMF